MDSTDWLRNANLDKYSGMWIAVCRNKLIAKDTDLSRVLNKIDSYKGRPTLMKVPTKNQILIL